MIGLIIAVILFNLIAFITNKRLTKNQIVHIWLFTITLHVIADLFIDQKYHGYWYFTQDVDGRFTYAYNAFTTSKYVVFELVSI